jgi:hypothetical protein
MVYITLTKEEAAACGEGIKQVCAKYPGSYTVFLIVDGVTIRSTFSMDSSDGCKDELHTILGGERCDFCE